MKRSVVNSSDNPLVSVLMLTYSRPQFIVRAIKSIQKQTIQNLEVILVHDGLNYETRTLVMDMAMRDSRLKYFYREHPTNIANASNFGISQSRGRYIAILDDDDFWIPVDKLARQVDFLEKSIDYVCCGGGLVVFDEKESEKMRYLKPMKPSAITKNALLANPLAHSTALYRTDIARRIGCYDESLSGFADWDFCLKLGKEGKLYNFGDYFAGYTMWPGNSSSKNNRGDAVCSLRIVRRHRKTYPRSLMATAAAIAFLSFSYLPASIRRPFYSALSRFKKRAFSGSERC